MIMMLTTIENHAQEDDVLQKYEIKRERLLGGHYFVPSNAVKTPFLLTHVRTSLGIGGISNLKFPLIDIGDQEYLYMQGDILAAILLFEYQHVVKDWLAVFARIGLTARLGSSVATLTKEGINYATSFSVGWMLKVMRNERFALSASIEVASGSYSIINIQKFIEDIINGSANPSLSTRTTPVFGIAGLKGAYGINKFIGFNAFFDIGYGESIQKDTDNKFFTIIGFNADMNFYSVIKTPVSLSVGYILSNYSEHNSEVVFGSNVFVAQISYIGRSDFVLSLDMLASQEESESMQSPVWLNTFVFSMKYLF